MRPEAVERREMIFGIHPVLEALSSGRRDVERILVAREGAGAGLAELLRGARQAGIPVTHLPREVLARKAGSRAVHQGVAAVVSAMSYADAEATCRNAAERRGILVVIDGVTDPGNLGAIVRTAAAAGALGILLGGESTVGITPVVAKASAGAVERIPIARELHLRRRLLALREAGFRVVALDSRGTLPWDRADLTSPLVVLAGGEAAGLRKGVLEAADERVRIPIADGVESLNVSVAVAVVLFEAVRRGRALGTSVPTP